jgi:hypothetical protein
MEYEWSEIAFYFSNWAVIFILLYSQSNSVSSEVDKNHINNSKNSPVVIPALLR